MWVFRAAHCFMQTVLTPGVGGKASNNKGSRTFRKSNTNAGWSTNHQHIFSLPVLIVTSSYVMLDTCLFVLVLFLFPKQRVFLQPYLVTLILTCAHTHSEKAPWAEGGSHTSSPIVSLKPYFRGVLQSFHPAIMTEKKYILLKWT